MGCGRRRLRVGTTVSRLDRLVWELKSRIAALEGVADELTEEERREVNEGFDDFLPMLVEY